MTLHALTTAWIKKSIGNWFAYIQILGSILVFGICLERIDVSHSASSFADRFNN